MKTNHKWRESSYERLLFMDATHNHSNASGSQVEYLFKPISFYCVARQAKSVEIVGDFNHGQPLAMQRSVNGWWFIQLQLCPGYHHYRFIVDGKPQLDPYATGVVRDEHNDEASLIVVD
ncbi:MAG TPA: glycogen-binding domain-containing protein [Verrucomicrobiae bacterium]|nr:glycogen-binding domain-containing protein [Verrucomicrobiae bacterium]